MSQFEAVFDYEQPGWTVVFWHQIDENTRRAEEFDRFTGADAEHNARETAYILQQGFEQEIADLEAQEFDRDYEEFPSGEFPRHFVY